MTYPGTVQKTFLEICEEQAAQGNPAAAAFVAKKKHQIPPAVVITDAITRTIEEQGFKYLNAIDPEIEAEIEDKKREKTGEILEAVKAVGEAMKVVPENLFFKPIPPKVADFDPEVDDGIPF